VTALLADLPRKNCWSAVYLVYARRRGHTMLDRELYLPRSWTIDPDRCAAAGVPDDVEFATRPALAAAMLARALDAGVPARWVTAEEVYGADPGLRADLEARQIGYVLAIGCDRRVPTTTGPLRADALAANVPKTSLAAALRRTGRKGTTPLRLGPNHPHQSSTTATRYWWLLVRKHTRTGELAFYRCYAPTPVSLHELVRVAGRRWTGGILPGWQGPDRARRTPTPPLAAQAEVDPPGDARPRPARRHRRPRTHPEPTTNRPHRTDLQRDPTGLLTTFVIEPARVLSSPRLVTLATTPPTPRPRQPLPPPTSATHMITIYGWSTSLDTKLAG
jgi:hypothetical protein